MQGQRSTIDPFPDAFEFSHGSGTTRTIADQQNLWSDMLNPAESRLANYLPSASTANISYADGVSHGARSMSGWNLGESSSSENARNQVTNCDEGKVQHGWSSSSSTTHAGATPLLDERRYEQENCGSFGSFSLNLNNNQMANGPLFVDNSNSNDVPQNLNLNAEYSGNSGSGGPGKQVMESGICPFLHKPGGSEIEHVPHVGGSSNPFGTASGSVGYITDESHGRPSCSMDGRRSSCKRKAVEGEASGKLSLGGSPGCFSRAETSAWHAASSSAGSSSISNPTENARVVNHPGPLNPQFGIGVRTVASDGQPALNAAGIVERSRRNSRVRINPTNQQDSAPSNLTLGGNAVSGNVWSSHQSSSRGLSSNQSLVLEPAAGITSSQIPSRVIHVPGLQHHVHPFPWNGASNSRGGSSSNSSVIPVDRSSILQEDVHPRMTHRNIPEHPMLSPATDMRNMAQDPTNWSLVTGNVTVPRNSVSASRAGSSSRIHGLPAFPWIPLQNPPAPHPQRLSEARRFLAPPTGSESGGQSSSIPLLMRSGPSSSQEINRQGHIQVHSRSGVWTQGDGVRGGPLSFRTLAAGIEGRSRLLSEIRSALDFLRRGGSVTFEDLALLNQSILLGVTDLHDRHRDMRLDVDNMTYEELLALEERIGNVNTGLSEENILKKMKQRNFLSIGTGDPSEVEPCCICQEEYSEGEDLGVLECGHDFHRDCIKQWLMQKNLCPICKTTALGT